jgi:acyl-CoA thioesterase FadM
LIKPNWSGQNRGLNAAADFFSGGRCNGATNHYRQAARKGIPLNLWFRLLLTFLLSRRRSRCSILGSCFTPFRVMPTDLDVAVHLNNGRYFSLLDVARMDYMKRSGSYPVLMRNRWYPVVTSETMQFHRALLPFERFFVETRLIGWDKRTFFIRHRLFRQRIEGELVAEAIVRGVMARRSGGVVPLPDVLNALGNPPRPEPMPAWIERWASAMDINRDEYKQQAASA